MATYIVFALLFFLPFLVFPFGISYFETPKIFVAQCLIQVLFLIQLLQKDFLLKNYDRRLILLASGLFLLSLLNFFLYPTDIAFFGNVFRLQGIYLFWHFLLFAILSSRVSMPVVGKPFFLILLGAELLLSYAFGETITHRFYGTLGEPHSLAAFALFIFPFALFAPVKLEKQQRMILSFIAFFIAFVLLLLSGSRSGMIGLFLECLFILLTYMASVKKASFIAIFLLFLSLSLPFFQQASLYENRRDVWITAAIAGSEKPLTGWGVGNIETAFEEVSIHVPNLIRNQYVDSSHNFFLDSWIQGGIVGIVLITLLLFFTIKRFVLERNKRNLMILIGVFTVMSFNPVSVTILITFWWLIGQGFIKSESDKKIND